MIEVNKNYKEETKNAIVSAANIILGKAEELSADIDELKVNGISIWISLEPGREPQLDITKTYLPM